MIEPAPATTAHQNPSDDELRSLLTEARTIAVVGASSKPDRPSHGVLRRLLSAGYQVYPVNPNERSVLGLRAYPSLDKLPRPVDIVDVFRRTEATPEVARQAVAVGAKVLWLQAGIWNEEAASLARAAGMRVVMDDCIAVAHSLLRVPARNPQH